MHPLQKVGSQISEIVINHKIINKVKLNKEVLELLRNVKIIDPERVVNLYPHQLSGGMRQRIGIAMAIANKPDITVADEPTTALDVTVQAKILSIINDLKKEFNLSIIFISHDLNVVSKISDNIAVMFNGEIVEFGNTKKILNNPNNQYTKKLIKTSPRLSLMKKKKTMLKIDKISKIFLTEVIVFFLIQKKYKEAVKNVSIEINGDTLGIIGETSGSGKSTLAKIIAFNFL